MFRWTDAYHVCPDWASHSTPMYRCLCYQQLLHTDLVPFWSTDRWDISDRLLTACKPQLMPFWIYHKPSCQLAYQTSFIWTQMFYVAFVWFGIDLFVHCFLCCLVFTATHAWNMIWLSIAVVLIMLTKCWITVGGQNHLHLTICRSPYLHYVTIRCTVWLESTLVTGMCLIM